MTYKDNFYENQQGKKALLKNRSEFTIYRYKIKMTFNHVKI